MTVNLPAEAFPADFDITKYSRYTVSAEFYNASMTIINPDWGTGGMVFLDGSTVILERYNLGMSDNSINSSLLASTTTQTNNNLTVPLNGIRPTAIRLSTMKPTTDAGYASFIRLKEVRFSGPTP